MIARLAKRFCDCERGVAALEFSLVAPFLIVLILGGYETSRFLIVQQKVEKIAFSIADVASQSAPDDGVNIDDVFAAVEQIMKPHPFMDQGLLVLTSVARDEAAAQPTVRWQCENDGRLSEDSKVGALNEDASLPQDFSVDEMDNIIVAEVFYEFSPLFKTVFTEPFVVYRTALFRPRLGALTAAPC